jgi:alanine racemase
MASTSDAIHAASQRFAELLHGTEQLVYAPSAWEKIKTHLKELDQQKQASDDKLAQLAKATEKERKEAISIKNSTGRKWSQKLIGQSKRHDAKVSKEEK